MAIYINRIIGDRVATTVTEPTGVQTLNISGGAWQRRLDGAICDITITSDPNTPQISTMLGVGPRYMPRETINP